MEYEITYVDGSVEIVVSENIATAREVGKELYNCPISRVVALGDDEGDAAELDPDEEDDEEDDEDADDNPDDEDEDDGEAA